MSNLVIVFGILIWPLSFVVAALVVLIRIPILIHRGRKEINCGIEAVHESYEYRYEDTEDYKEEVIEEELPFCQLFAITPNMSLLIDHVEMCPDETAFIRVVDEDGYTPIYKRKVKRNKRGDRFIVFNNTNLYLDDKKTQPVIIKK